MILGPFQLSNQLLVAPMAGVTDRPFRQLCKKLGAAYAVSEMIASNAMLWNSEKTLRRANHDGETSPISVQIAGADPSMMAQAALLNIDRGAQIIDINMGCPAKKVCNVASGSALLQNEPLVARILEEIVKSVQLNHPKVPVTLKIRTGWDRNHKNAIRIAKIAEDNGIAMLTIHGRTKADLYHGEAEYETIAEVKASVKIPIVANGDINSPEKAKLVLEKTNADAIMIGRAAQGKPWIFREIDHFLKTGNYLPAPNITEISSIMHDHLLEHYSFYGDYIGLRSARKHIAWYCKGLRNSHQFRARMNTIESCEEQLKAVQDYFEELRQYSEKIQYLEAA